jgi:hypothetical protein
VKKLTLLIFYNRQHFKKGRNILNWVNGYKPNQTKMTYPYFSRLILNEPFLRWMKEDKNRTTTIKVFGDKLSIHNIARI